MKIKFWAYRFSFRSLVMATGYTVNEVITRDDADLDKFRITYSKYLGRFECPWEKWKTPSTKNLLNWKFFETDNSNIPGKKEELDRILPVWGVDWKKIQNPPEDKIQVTWIGHATLLVQFDGITILTDPVFREYCGPKVPGIPLGYKRYRKAACQVEHIPHIDVVIVSHDHFDHLDSESAKEISKKFPDVKWFVAKNSRDLCHMKKEENVTDLEWWQEKTIEVNGKRFTFACTPTQHWCRRSAFDMNKRLWCSWVVKGPTKSFYFAGDTGYYEPVFKKIGEKYGPFSLSALPIGCIEPRHVLEYQHVSPAEAAKIHYNVKSEFSVSMHWGTFKTMAVEFYLDPPHLLEKAMGKDKDKFISLQHGETWVVGTERRRPAFMDSKSNETSGETDVDTGRKTDATEGNAHGTEERNAEKIELGETANEKDLENNDVRNGAAHGTEEKQEGKNESGETPKEKGVENEDTRNGAACETEEKQVEIHKSGETPKEKDEKNKEAGNGAAHGTEDRHLEKNELGETSKEVDVENKDAGNGAVHGTEEKPEEKNELGETHNEIDVENKDTGNGPAHETKEKQAEKNELREISEGTCRE